MAILLEVLEYRPLHCCYSPPTPLSTQPPRGRRYILRQTSLLLGGDFNARMMDSEDYAMQVGTNIYPNQRGLATAADVVFDNRARFLQVVQ
eukprot:6039891-Amphidinium_carterae.1